MALAVSFFAPGSLEKYQWHEMGYKEIQSQMRILSSFPEAVVLEEAVVLRIFALKNFAKFTGKYLSQSFF